MYLVRVLIYGFAKFLVIVSTRLFYFPIYQKGEERFNRKSKPTILASNHPNTMLDCLNVAERIPWQMTHFLGNANMFQTKFNNWFFSTFFVIPIQRKQDTGNRKFDNKKSFAKVNAFLETGGALFIAPEGGSNIARRLRPLKSGTARMALNAEYENDFQLGLEILPIGQNYTDQTSFRSQLFINVGEPIIVADYKEAYEKDNFEAATKITEELDKRMRALIVDTKDDEEDFFIRKIEKVCQTENELPFNEVVYRSQKLIANWRSLQEENPSEAVSLKEKVESYFSILQKNKTSDAIASRIHQGAKNTWWLRMLGVVFGWPFFIYGWINNFLANYIPKLLMDKSGLYIGFTSCVKTLMGVFTYPIFYGLQIWLVSKLVPENYMVWGYILSVMVFGLFAWWYKDFAKDTFSGQRFIKQKEQGIELRKSIVEKINHNLLSKQAIKKASI